MASHGKSSHGTPSGGNVRNTAKLGIWGVLAVFAVGLLSAGCKAKPELSPASALAMIQAKYDQSPAVGIDIAISDRGMREGVTAKYWEGAKKYPNGYWADFKLTPEGKKLVKLANGGDVIAWRPDSPDDNRYALTVTTLAVSRPQARAVRSIEDMGDTETAEFTEDVDLSGLPAPLQTIAHNPGNQLSAQRTATFVLNGGAWTLQSIQ
jgi:hypothetical protein